MPRYFTRGEAEELLPRVEPLLREIQALRATLANHEAELAEMHIKAMSNGHAQASEIQRSRTEASAALDTIRAHITTINALSIEVKDLDTGLIDFLARRGNRDVYLCWRLGESRIDWWHPLESGFAGRRSMDEF